MPIDWKRFVRLFNWVLQTWRLADSNPLKPRHRCETTSSLLPKESLQSPLALKIHKKFSSSHMTRRFSPDRMLYAPSPMGCL
jgi:hypothetical protein